MVDKNGRLFGKINLIDFLIILVIVLGVIFLALRATGVVGTPPAEQVEVEMKMLSTEVPDYVLDYIVSGESVLDYNENITMGTVVSYTTDAPQGYSYDANGEMKYMEKVGHKSVELTLTATGELTEHGLKIKNFEYGVGHSVTIFAGKAKIFGKISSIEIIE